MKNTFIAPLYSCLSTLITDILVIIVCSAIFPHISLDLILAHYKDT